MSIIIPDILPESVLKHYGYGSRPEGNIGKSALFSRDVNIDEFDETEYTNVKLSKAEYNKLYSEALTWDSDKVGQICYKYFNNKRYYYILNEDYDIKILGVYNSNDKKGAEYKNVDRKRRNISGRHEASENTNGNDRSHNGFVSNGRTATNNAELNKEEIQREGDGNRTRIVENDDNDNLSEEKYSRDVDYAEYAQHIVRFLKQI